MDDLFEWDLAKAEANLKKYGVSFEEAAEVFFDSLSLTVADPLPSDEENTFYHQRIFDERKSNICRSHGQR